MRRARRDGFFEHLPVAAVLVGSRKKVQAANRLARQLTGVLKTPRGATCRELLGCLLPEARCPLRRAAARGGVVPRTEIPVRLKGRKGWVIERVSDWRRRDGRRAAVLVWGPATAFHRSQRALRGLAHRDGLTGVLNRRGFTERVRSSLKRRRGDRSAALLMLDVDGLKRINDERGHAAGDRQLVRLGAVLRAVLRATDLAGRVGGDEFAVYCPGLDRPRAAVLARRIQEALARDAKSGKRHLPVSVSIGLSCARRPRLASLRAAADRSLYREKARRGSVRPRAVADPLLGKGHQEAL